MQQILQLQQQLQMERQQFLEQQQKFLLDRAKYDQQQQPFPQEQPIPQQQPIQVDFNNNDQPSASGICLPNTNCTEDSTTPDESEGDEEVSCNRISEEEFKERLIVQSTYVIFAYGDKLKVGLVVEHFEEEGHVNIKCMDKQHYGRFYYTWPHSDLFHEVPYSSIRTIIPTPAITNKRLRRYYPSIGKI